MVFSWMMGLSLCLSLSMWLVGSPLVMMVSLIVLSILMSVISSVVYSTWYGLILFLTYVGGLLVLFMYITMISSNYKSAYNLKHVVYILFSGFIFTFSNYYLLSENLDHQLPFGLSFTISGFSLPNLMILLLITLLLISMLCIMGILMSSGKSIKIKVL